MNAIQRTREVIAYENDYVTVNDDEVRWASGRTGHYVKVMPKGAGLGVVIIPQLVDTFGLVRTFRYPIGDYQWAFPRGFSHGEDVVATAAAELEEELGAVAESMAVIGHVTPDSGLLGTRVAIVHAHLGATTEPEDEDEVTGVEWVDLTTLRERVRGGAIEDGFTLAALALLRSRVL